MNQFWLKHRHFFRLVSIALLFSFFLYDICWAQGGSLQLNVQNYPVRFQVPEIPKDVGSVSQVFFPKEKPESPVIYHIQDAHAIYDAQKNLSQILKELITKDKVTTVLVEGGSGNLSLSDLRKYAPKDIRREVGSQFLKEGKISGEEFLDLSTDYKLRLMGIEDKAIYEENLNVFLSCLRRKTEALKITGLIEDEIRTLERKIYTKDFLELVRAKESSERGISSLLDYIRLLDQAAKEQKVDLSPYHEWRKLLDLKDKLPIESFDFERFTQELKEIERLVQITFLKTDEAKGLFQFSENAKRLKRLFLLELTPEDYGLFLENPKTFDIEAITDSLRSLSNSNSWILTDRQINFLKTELPNFLKFYSLAKRRDQIFIQKVIDIVKRDHLSSLVLITGGFHTAGISQYFKDKGFGYVLISPAISEIEKDSSERYEKIIKSKIKNFTLRPPATVGTPVYFELRDALERTAEQRLGPRIRELISYLDIDRYLKPESQESKGPRSEMRRPSHFKARMSAWVFRILLTLSVFGFFGASQTSAQSPGHLETGETASLVTHASEHVQSPFLKVRDVKKVHWARDLGLGPAVGAIVELNNGREIIYGGSHGKDLLFFARDLGLDVRGEAGKEPFGYRTTKIDVHTDQGVKSLTYPEVFEHARSSQASKISSAGPRFSAGDISKVDWSRGTRGLFTLGHSPVVGAIVHLSNGREIIYGGSHGDDLKYFAEDLGLKVTGIVHRESIGTAGIASRRATKIEVESNGRKTVLDYEGVLDLARRSGEEQSLQKEIQNFKPDSPFNETKSAETPPSQNEKESLSSQAVQTSEPDIASKPEPVPSISIDEHREAVSALQSKNTEQAEKIKALEQEKDNQAEQIKVLEKENREQTGMFKSLQAEKEKAESEKGQIEESKASLEKELSGVKSLLQEKQMALDLIQKAANALKAEVSKWQDESKSAGQKSAELTEANQNLQNEIDSLKDSNQKQSIALEETKKALEEKISNATTQPSPATQPVSNEPAHHFFKSVWPWFLTGIAVLLLIPYLFYLKRQLRRRDAMLEEANQKLSQAADRIKSLEAQIDLLIDLHEKLLEEKEKMTPPPETKPSGGDVSVSPPEIKPAGSDIETPSEQPKVNKREILLQAARTRKRLREEIVKKVIDENKETYPVLSIKAFRFLLDRSGYLKDYEEKYGAQGISDATFRKDLSEAGLLSVRDKNGRPIGQRTYYYPDQGTFFESLSQDPEERKTAILNRGHEVEEALGLRSKKPTQGLEEIAPEDHPEPSLSVQAESPVPPEVSGGGAAITPEVPIGPSPQKEEVKVPEEQAAQEPPKETPIEPKPSEPPAEDTKPDQNETQADQAVSGEPLTGRAKDLAIAKGLFGALEKRLIVLEGISDEEAEINEIEAANKQLKETYSDLLGELSNPEAGIEAVIGRLRENIKTLKEEEQAKKERLKNLKSGLEVLQRRANEIVNQSAQEMEDRLKPVQNELSALQPAIDEFKEETKEEVGKVQAAIEQVKTRIDEASKGERAPPPKKELNTEEKLKALLSDPKLETLWTHLKSVFNLSKSKIESELLARLHEAGTSSDFRKVIDLIYTYGSIAEARKQDPEYAKYKSSLEKSGLNTDLNQASLELSYQVGKDSYRLLLSEGTVEDLIRGYISGDCTNPGFPAQAGVHPEAPFNKYLIHHLLSPDFLSFKVLNPDGKWIGNIYAFIGQREDEPILFIEAAQIPWKGAKLGERQDGLELPYGITRNFLVRDEESSMRIARVSVDTLVTYAKHFGFKEAWMGFVSNFIPIVSDFQLRMVRYYDEYGVPPFGSEKKVEVRFVHEAKTLAEYEERVRAIGFKLRFLSKEKIDSFNLTRGFARIWRMKEEVLWIPPPKFKRAQAALAIKLPDREGEEVEIVTVRAPDYLTEEDITEFEYEATLFFDGLRGDVFYARNADDLSRIESQAQLFIDRHHDEISASRTVMDYYRDHLAKEWHEKGAHLRGVPSVTEIKEGIKASPRTSTPERETGSVPDHTIPDEIDREAAEQLSSVFQQLMVVISAVSTPDELEKAKDIYHALNSSFAVGSKTHSDAELLLKQAAEALDRKERELKKQASHGPDGKSSAPVSQEASVDREEILKFLMREDVRRITENFVSMEDRLKIKPGSKFYFGSPAADAWVKQFRYDGKRMRVEAWKLLESGAFRHHGGTEFAPILDLEVKNLPGLVDSNGNLLINGFLDYLNTTPAYMEGRGTSILNVLDKYDITRNSFLRSLERAGAVLENPDGNLTFVEFSERGPWFNHPRLDTAKVIDGFFFGVRRDQMLTDHSHRDFILKGSSRDVYPAFFASDTEEINLFDWLKTEYPNHRLLLIVQARAAGEDRGPEAGEEWAPFGIDQREESELLEQKLNTPLSPWYLTIGTSEGKIKLERRLIGQNNQTADSPNRILGHLTQVEPDLLPEWLKELPDKWFIKGVWGRELNGWAKASGGELKPPPPTFRFSGSGRSELRLDRNQTLNRKQLFSGLLLGSVLGSFFSGGPTFLVSILILLFSASLHEFAHGWQAFRLKDVTAKNEGRLSLNPLKHIDPFGTIILPLLFSFFHLPVIGYMKPVRVDFDLLGDQGLRKVALAGPLANLSASLGAFILFYLFASFAVIGPAFFLAVKINLTLGLFNLLPIPSFDGWHVWGEPLLSWFQGKSRAKRSNWQILLEIYSSTSHERNSLAKIPVSHVFGLGLSFVVFVIFHLPFLSAICDSMTLAKLYEQWKMKKALEAAGKRNKELEEIRREADRRKKELDEALVEFDRILTGFWQVFSKMSETKTKPSVLSDSEFERLLKYKPDRETTENAIHEAADQVLDEDLKKMALEGSVTEAEIERLFTQKAVESLIGRGVIQSEDRDLAEKLVTGLPMEGGSPLVQTFMKFLSKYKLLESLAGAYRELKQMQVEEQAPVHASAVHHFHQHGSHVHVHSLLVTFILGLIGTLFGIGGMMLSLEPKKSQDPWEGIDLSDDEKKVLAQFTVDILDSEAKPVIGRANEIDRIERELSAPYPAKNSVLLRGERGVGKTALIRALAERMKTGEAPRFLRGRKILTLRREVGSNVREFQKIVMILIPIFIKSRGQLIFFIDEFHRVAMGEFNQPDRWILNALKPDLEEGRITLIGATTNTEFQQYLEPDKAFLDRIYPIEVQEPTLEENYDIAEGVLSYFKDRYNMEVPQAKAVAHEAVDLAAGYLTDHSFPRKVVDLIDRTFRHVGTRADRLDHLVNELIKMLERRGNQYLAMLGEARSAEEEITLHNQIVTIIQDLAKLLSERSQVYTDHIEPVDVKEYLSDATRIDMINLTKDDAQKYQELEVRLGQFIVGQGAAVKKVASAVRRTGSGFKSSDKPNGVFLFVGPTGTGKTELAFSLARILFGPNATPVKINMGEYSEETSVTKITGASPGYAGYGEKIKLMDEVKDKPHSVVLLDEIEKADKSIQKPLLGVFDHGTLTDGTGRTVDYRHTIVIMTSNLGTSAFTLETSSTDFDPLLTEYKQLGRKLKHSSDQGETDQILGRMREIAWKFIEPAVDEYFSPEFRNRLDGIIVFDPLTPKDLKEVAKIQLKRMVEDTDAVKKQGYRLEVEDKVYTYLVREGYHPEFGARPLKRAIDQLVIDPLADYILRERVAGRVISGGTIRIWVPTKEVNGVEEMLGIRFEVKDEKKIKERINPSGDIAQAVSKEFFDELKRLHGEGPSGALSANRIREILKLGTSDESMRQTYRDLLISGDRKVYGIFQPRMPLNGSVISKTFSSSHGKAGMKDEKEEEAVREALKVAGVYVQKTAFDQKLKDGFTKGASDWLKEFIFIAKAGTSQGLPVQIGYGSNDGAFSATVTRPGEIDGSEEVLLLRSLKENPKKPEEVLDLGRNRKTEGRSVRKSLLELKLMLQAIPGLQFGYFTKAGETTYWFSIIDQERIRKELSDLAALKPRIEQEILEIDRQMKDQLEYLDESETTRNEEAVLRPPNWFSVENDFIKFKQVRQQNLLALKATRLEREKELGETQKKIESLSAKQVSLSGQLSRAELRELETKEEKELLRRKKIYEKSSSQDQSKDNITMETIRRDLTAPVDRRGFFEMLFEDLVEKFSPIPAVIGALVGFVGLWWVVIYHKDRMMADFGTVGAPIMLFMLMFVAPVITAFLAYVPVYILSIPVVIIGIIVSDLVRDILFPFRYRKLIELHSSPEGHKNPRILKGAVKLLSRLELDTLIEILGFWAERGEKEKVEAVLQALSGSGNKALGLGNLKEGIRIETQRIGEKKEFLRKLEKLKANVAALITEERSRISTLSRIRARVTAIGRLKIAELLEESINEKKASIRILESGLERAFREVEVKKEEAVRAERKKETSDGFTQSSRRAELRKEDEKKNVWPFNGLRLFWESLPPRPRLDLGPIQFAREVLKEKNPSPGIYVPPVLVSIPISFWILWFVVSHFSLLAPVDRYVDHVSKSDPGAGLFLALLICFGGALIGLPLLGVILMANVLILIIGVGLIVTVVRFVRRLISFPFRVLSHIITFPGKYRRLLQFHQTPENKIDTKSLRSSARLLSQLDMRHIGSFFEIWFEKGEEKKIDTLIDELEKIMGESAWAVKWRVKKESKSNVAIRRQKEQMLRRIKLTKTELNRTIRTEKDSLALLKEIRERTKDKARLKVVEDLEGSIKEREALIKELESKFDQMVEIERGQLTSETNTVSPVRRAELRQPSQEAESLSLKQRLANEIRTIWQDLPEVVRLENEVGYEIVKRLTRTNPDLFNEARWYFGSPHGIAAFAYMIGAKPVEKKLHFANDDTLDELLANLKADKGRWLIAIDRAGATSARELWNAIGDKNVVLGELYEEMAFIEAEQQLNDWYFEVTTTKDERVTEATFFLRGRELEDYLHLGAGRSLIRELEARTFRHFDALVPKATGVHVLEAIHMMLLNPAGPDDFRKDYVKNVQDRITVYLADQSDGMIEKMKLDPDFPFTRIARIKTVMSEEGKRRLSIEYSDVGKQVFQKPENQERSELRKGSFKTKVDQLPAQKDSVYVTAFQKRKKAINELTVIGRPAVPALIDSLNSQSLSLRLALIQILGAIGDQRAVGPLGNLSQVLELKEAVKEAVDSIRVREDSKRQIGIQPAGSDPSKTLPSSSVSSALNEFIASVSTGNDLNEQSIKFIETLLKQGPVTVDLDAESLITKENGRTRLLGWGFIEALKALEQKLPDHVLNQIKIRIVNLNRTLKPSEIEQALGVSPELKGMIEVVNIPVNHQRFTGVNSYLGRESLKIGSERNMLLWQDHVDILVKTPRKNEAIDGRKLFLVSLLHARLKKQLPGDIRRAVERLLSGLNLEITSGASLFNPDSRSRLDFAFIERLERMNKLLAQAA